MGEDTVKRNKRQQQWINDNRDRINLTFTKGLKEEVQAAADAAGMSKAQWVEAAIREKMERQNGSAPAPAAPDPATAPAGYDRQRILDELSRVPGIGKRAFDRVADLLP